MDARLTGLGMNILYFIEQHQQWRQATSCVGLCARKPTLSRSHLVSLWAYLPPLRGRLHERGGGCI